MELSHSTSSVIVCYIYRGCCSSSGIICSNFLKAWGCDFIRFYNLHCSLIREDYFIHAAIRSIKSSKLSPSSIRCVRPFSMSLRPRWMAAISSGVNSSSFQPFPSQHLTKALTLDKSESKKNAQNDKVFPFFLRSILFPLAPLGKATNRCLNRTQKHRSFLPLLQIPPFKPCL